MYDIERIKKEFIEVCEKAGVEVNVPISINSRLTATLGRVRHYGSKSHIDTIAVEFSKKFIETATDSCIRDVILHEAAHHIINCRTHIAHGHDALFKAVCAEIGTTNDTAKTNVEYTEGVQQKTEFKYEVYCSDCEQMIGQYSRMCKTLTNISRCSCSLCGGKSLYIIKNW